MAVAQSTFAATQENFSKTEDTLTVVPPTDTTSTESATIPATETATTSTDTTPSTESKQQIS